MTWHLSLRSWCKPCDKLITRSSARPAMLSWGVYFDPTIAAKNLAKTQSKAAGRGLWWTSSLAAIIRQKVSTASEATCSLAALCSFFFSLRKKSISFLSTKISFLHNNNSEWIEIKVWYFTLLTSINETFWEIFKGSDENLVTLWSNSRSRFLRGNEKS